MEVQTTNLTERGVPAPPDRKHRSGVARPIMHGRHVMTAVGVGESRRGDQISKTIAEILEMRTIGCINYMI